MKWKKTLNCILFLVAIVAVERFCHHKTKGFRDHKIYSSFPNEERFDRDTALELTEEANHILSQNFYFLGDGGQGYSFVSEDGSFVLKLFKVHHMRVPNILEKLPLFGILEEQKQKFILFRKQNKEKIFGSCKVAFDHFKEETGLIYLHLNPTNEKHPIVTIFDAIGAKHHIQLDKAPFALQYKAELAFTDLKANLIAQEDDKIEKSIDSFTKFISLRSQKGIEDLDLGLKRNYGFLNDQFIEIDIGSFRYNDKLINPQYARTEMLKKTEGLRKIVEIHYKEKIPYLDQSIEKALK